jgi:hypothetical protein
MQFIINEKTNIDTREGFVVKIETMIGDADGEGLIEVGPFEKDKEEHLLEELIKLCIKLSRAYPNGRGGDDGYNHIEGFEKWFSEYCDEEENQEEIEHLTEFNWPTDPQTWGQQGYKSYEIIYIKNGIEYPVTIKH